MIESMTQKLEYLNRQSEILLMPPPTTQKMPQINEFIQLVREFRQELQKTQTSLERLKKKKGITGQVEQLQ
ncbi:MAG: hypothetical protein QXG67_04840 [Candidatus Nitrosotenuis sp.]|nr:hypothetical protein [Candidatus Nitrosotenuis sp.]